MSHQEKKMYTLNKLLLNCFSMTTIKELIDIEDELLKLNSKYKFEYSLDELITSNQYLEEIGKITDIFFKTQIEYGEKIDKTDADTYKRKLTEYRNKLINNNINIDTSKYISFLNNIKLKIVEKER